MKLSVHYNLKTVNPDLAREWDVKKNKALSPDKVTPGSSRKVWWLCKNGHSWKASVNTRNKSGCPFCAGRKACPDNCLQTLDPELAKQWHPNKNNELTPQNVSYGSNKKVWWLCPNGHEWQSRVYVRHESIDCPHCRRERVYQKSKYHR
jgi:hypothetical protein